MNADDKQPRTFVAACAELQRCCYELFVRPLEPMLIRILDATTRLLDAIHRRWDER